MATSVRKLMSVTEVLTPQILAEVKKEKYRGSLVAISLLGEGLIGAAGTMEGLERLVIEVKGGEHPFTARRGPR